MGRGFDAPKGIVLAGDMLYVSDIDRLVAVDLESGAIRGTWPAEGAVFLNDTAVDSAGRVYVSDMMTDRVYVLDGDSVSVWLEDEALAHPNGLEVQDGKLLVAAWGKDIQDDFTTKEPGRLLSVDLETKAITPVGDGPGVGISTASSPTAPAAGLPLTGSPAGCTGSRGRQGRGDTGSWPGERRSGVPSGSEARHHSDDARRGRRRASRR